MNFSPSLLVDCTPSFSFRRVPTAHHSVPQPPASRPARWWAVAALAVLAWAGTAAWQVARAGELVWSIGVQAPGAAVHVANAPPPMVVVRPPVYAVAPPVVVYDGWGRPAPYSYYAPPPPPPRHGWHGRGHGHHRHHWQEYHGGWDQPRGSHRGHDPRFQGHPRDWGHR